MLKRKKITEVELAKISGVNRSLLQRWARGEMIPSEANAKKLRDVGYIIEYKITVKKDS